MLLRLRADIATTDTDDGLVLLDERSGRYWQLNPTGAQVLRALLKGRPCEQIAQDLVSRYGVGIDQAHQDVIAVTDQLRAAKLVTPS